MGAAKSLAGAILLLAGLTAMLMGTAEAKKKKSPSVTFTKIEPELVAGKLTNTSKKCRKGRTVIIKYEAPGAIAQSSKLEKLGKAKTNKKGKFKRPGSYFIGHYKAIVKPKTVKKRGRKDPGVSEEEAEEEDELDDDAGAAGKTKCEGTFTTTDE